MLTATRQRAGLLAALLLTAALASWCADPAPRHYQDHRHWTAPASSTAGLR